MKYETFGAFLLAVAMPIMAAPAQPDSASVEDAVRAIVQQQQHEQQPKVEARVVLPNPGVWTDPRTLVRPPFRNPRFKYAFANGQPAIARRDVGGDVAAGDDEATGDDEALLERRKNGSKTNAINAIANLASSVLPWLGLGQRDLSAIEGAGLEARGEPILSEAEVRDTIASVIDQYEQANQKRDTEGLERRKNGSKTNAINAIANLASSPILSEAEVRDTIASVIDQYEQQANQKRDVGGFEHRRNGWKPSTFPGTVPFAPTMERMPWMNLRKGGVQKRDVGDLERRKNGSKTNAINAIANLANSVLPWLGLGQRDLSAVEGAAAGLEARDEPILSEAEIRDTIASVIDQYEQQGSVQKRDVDGAALERRKFGRKTNAINAIANLAGSVLPWLGLGQRDLSAVEGAAGLAARDVDGAALERRKFGRKTNAINAIANLAGSVLPWLGLGQRDLSAIEGAGLEARSEPVLTEAEVRDTIASVIDQYEAQQKRDETASQERVARALRA
ncbi:hypothetical protein MAPG_02072 [Magnaporthiopsis poae ATCC 64411]|uniref:Uncharacterized protein n=1 Tax=Magnaporthiopsis poae (strain ATCC 64411 / 73-15) TaxID=644358 RepID=A0A0C4DQD3_MAGP6|nr:hypothetical protein MAPG_02072 [Magnaporthiopsis poae ATCC 64411]